MSGNPKQPPLSSASRRTLKPFEELLVDFIALELLKHKVPRVIGLTSTLVSPAPHAGSPEKAPLQLKDIQLKPPVVVCRLPMNRKPPRYVTSRAIVAVPMKHGDAIDAISLALVPSPDRTLVMLKHMKSFVYPTALGVGQTDRISSVDDIAGMVRLRSSLHRFGVEVLQALIKKTWLSLAPIIASFRLSLLTENMFERPCPAPAPGPQR